MKTRFVFIGGRGRSGTTLLQSILDSHSQIASGPEFDLLPEFAALYRLFIKKHELQRINLYLSKRQIQENFRKFIEASLIPYAIKKNKSILVEKTPLNIFAFDVLVKLFPDAKFIHMIRDGRDVVCSHLEVGNNYRINHRWINDKSLKNVYASALAWDFTIKTGVKFCSTQSKQGSNSRCLTLKYENLINNPHSEIKRVCDFIGIKMEASMLQHHNNPHDVILDNLWYNTKKYWRPISHQSISRWRKEWRWWQKLQFAAAAGETLIKMGYEKNYKWIYPIPLSLVRLFRFCKSFSQAEIIRQVIKCNF